MKKLYVFILFLVFFNVFVFMFSSLGIFTYTYPGDASDFGIDDAENIPGTGEGVFENLSGAGFNDLLGLFFADLSDAGNILISLAILGVAVILNLSPLLE